MLNLAIKNDSINTLLIGFNKLGSLLEAKSLIEEAKKNKIHVITETSNYETDDNFLVHFAIAFNLPVLKYGIYRKDRDKIEEIKKIEKLMKIK
jgi:pentatricopeptide repeat protein